MMDIVLKNTPQVIGLGEINSYESMLVVMEEQGTGYYYPFVNQSQFETKEFNLGLVQLEDNEEFVTIKGENITVNVIESVLDYFIEVCKSYNASMSYMQNCYLVKEVIINYNLEEGTYEIGTELLYNTCNCEIEEDKGILCCCQ